MKKFLAAPVWQASLRSRILLVSIVIFGFTSIAVFFNSIYMVKNVMLENVRIAEQQTSKILLSAAAPFAISGDFDTLKVFLDEVLPWGNNEYGLVYLVICAEDSRLLLKSGAVNGASLPEPDIQDALTRAVNRGVVHIRHPLLLQNNAIGFLQYGLSFKRMVRASQRMNLENAIMIVTGLSLVSYVLLAVILKIIRRMKVLGKISLAIAEGNYSYRAQEYGGDEISLLACNFNRMADAIELRIQEITQLNQDLESRVEARTRDLVSVNKTLEETIKNLKWTQDNLIRSEKLAGLGSLVAGIAHELNTPIGNALIVASTLQDNTDALHDEFRNGLRRATLENFLQDTTQACHLIVRNLQRTADLMTSFKHVAVDQASEHCREFNLSTTINETIATLSPMLKKTSFGLELQIPDEINMRSYPGAISQIVTNLIDNMIHHAFEGRSEGEINLSAVLQDDDKVLLTFLDNGIGMNAQTVNRIFDPFFTTKLGQGGSGLGMSIVYNLVSSVLGGEIQVDSTLGQGTRFEIRLPLYIEVKANNCSSL